MQKVESFKLDHTKVKAPYIRKCCELKGTNGEETCGTAAIHGLEHLLATYLRETLDGIIDLSPMGCRTGFYLIMWGEVKPQTVKDGLEKALKMVLEATEIPAATRVECGNYKDLSLFGAKEYAKEALEKGFSLNIYGD